MYILKIIQIVYEIIFHNFFNINTEHIVFKRHEFNKKKPIVMINLQIPIRHSHTSHGEKCVVLRKCGFQGSRSRCAYQHVND